MQYVIQICKVAIIVFLTAVVAVLFSTLTGCRGCSQQEEAVRWVPATRDTIPEVEIEDSLCVVDPVGEDSVVVNAVITPIAKKKPSLSKPKKTIPNDEDCFSTHYDQATIHSWSEEFELDSIELTIIVSGLEMQITQNLN